MKYELTHPAPEQRPTDSLVCRHGVGGVCAGPLGDIPVLLGLMQICVGMAPCHNSWDWCMQVRQLHSVLHCFPQVALCYCYWAGERNGARYQLCSQIGITFHCLSETYHQKSEYSPHCVPQTFFKDMLQEEQITSLCAPNILQVAVSRMSTPRGVFLPSLKEQYRALCTLSH